MSGLSLESAIERWQQVLGKEAVHSEESYLSRYTRNVSSFKKNIPAVLQPASTKDVQAIVQVANEFRVPLYPVSSGKNWGLGSSLPIIDGNVIVDLSHMNTIREVNVDHHYAVIEPGVTQGQLYDYLTLENLPLIVNVTGSGRDTSILGNSLDRGVGYFASRADSLISMEVVLGNGQILNTGFGHFPKTRIRCQDRHGVGPGIDGLFYQSNFGIVTSAVIELMPRSECHSAMIVKVGDEEKLPELIGVLGELINRRMIQSVTHIANRSRTEISLSPLIYDYLSSNGGSDRKRLYDETREIFSLGGFSAWSAVTGLYGSPDQLRVARREIRKELYGLAKVRFVDDTKLAIGKRVCESLRCFRYFRHQRALLHAIEPFYGLSKGIPTDAALRSVHWPVETSRSNQETDLDSSDSGLLYCLPFLPMNGSVIGEAVRYAQEVMNRFNFVPYLTLNLLNSTIVEFVISISFDRQQPDQVAAAQKCVATLESDFVDQGYIPYRVGIESMSKVVNKNDVFWRTVRDLKAVLDPNHIIAPGRYNLI